MIAAFDQLWIALGVDEEELFALKARRFAYAGFIMMAGLSTFLVSAISSNLMGGSL